MLPKRIVITMMNEDDQVLMEDLDEFRFMHRYDSRSAAARAAMRMGLKAAKSTKPPMMMKRKHRG